MCIMQLCAFMHKEDQVKSHTQAGQVKRHPGDGKAESPFGVIAHLHTFFKLLAVLPHEECMTLKVVLGIE